MSIGFGCKVFAYLVLGNFDLLATEVSKGDISNTEITS